MLYVLLNFTDCTHLLLLAQVLQYTYYTTLLLSTVTICSGNLYYPGSCHFVDYEVFVEICLELPEPLKLTHFLFFVQCQLIMMIQLPFLHFAPLDQVLKLYQLILHVVEKGLNVLQTIHTLRNGDC